MDRETRSSKQSVNKWLGRRFSHQTDTVSARIGSHLYTLFLDHAVLRMLWHNFSEVAPGVYRSNHPSNRRLERYAARGIRVVLSLRGGMTKAPNRFEAETCARLGLRLVQIQMTATRAPKKAKLEQLVEVFRTLEDPILIHCKSGADRTGLAAAVYLMTRRGMPVAQARRQLLLRRLHFKWGRAGVLDLMLADFAKAEARGIGFADWVRTDYDDAETDRRFRALGLRARLAL